MIEFKGFKLDSLEHMMHIDNLENVLTHGLLPHNAVYERSLIKKDISMPEVQNLRQKKLIVLPNGTLIPVHDCVPFYFNTKNPMLYTRKNYQADIIILAISIDVLTAPFNKRKFAMISDGNAGAYATQFYHGAESLSNLDLDLIFANSWYDSNPEILRQNRRKRCAEVLIYPSIQTDEIQKIICQNDQTLEKVTSLLSSAKLKIKCEHIAAKKIPGYFF